MTFEEYALVFDTIRVKPTTLYLDEIEDRSDRTLLYGYDASRNTWHTCLAYGMITHLIYKGSDILVQRSSLFHLSEQIVPNKRLYPEACDFEFCAILKQKGVFLPFTTFDKNRAPKTFHGRIL